MEVHFDNQCIVRSEDNDILDVDCWGFNEEQGLNMLHGRNDGETFRHSDMKGRKFKVNNDGTISPTT